MCVIATAGVIFFGSDQKYIAYFAPHLFFTALVFYIPGVYLIYRHYKKKNSQRLYILRKPVEQFKKSAVKKNVDLSQCDIVPACEEFVQSLKKSMNYHLNFQDTLYSKEFLTNELCENDYHLVYKEGDAYFVTTAISLDEAEISEELRVKRYTDLYVDQTNPEKYYFDIEFLEV